MMVQEGQAAEEEDAYSQTSLLFSGKSCAVRMMGVALLAADAQ
jgi:hypothetical protein